MATNNFWLVSINFTSKNDYVVLSCGGIKIEVGNGQRNGIESKPKRPSKTVTDRANQWGQSKVMVNENHWYHTNAHIANIAHIPSLCWNVICAITPRKAISMRTLFKTIQSKAYSGTWMFTSKNFPSTVEYVCLDFTTKIRKFSMKTGVSKIFTERNHHLMKCNRRKYECFACGKSFDLFRMNLNFTYAHLYGWRTI